MSTKIKTQQNGQVNGEFTELAKNIKKTNAIAKEVMEEHKEAEAQQPSQESQTLTNEAIKEVVNQAIQEHQAEQEKESKKQALQKKFGKKTKDGYSSAEARKKRKLEENSINQNLTNGEGFVDTLISFGPSWDPVLATFTVASLTLLLQTAREHFDDVRENRLEKTDTVGNRRELFEPVPALFTRVYNQIIACGASKSIIASAKHTLDLMRGERMGNPKPGANTKSTSHVSDSDMVSHVADFLVILQKCPQYDSNQAELKIPALETLKDNLQNENSLVSKSKANWKTSIKVRNKFFNAKNTGYVDTFQAAKRAAKAIYGGNSVEYHQLAQFVFRRIRS
ncbi:MAG: cell envelope integrity protein TolA [Gelidibacter sp.]